MTRNVEPVRWKADPAAAPSGAGQALQSYGEQRATPEEQSQLQARLAALLEGSVPARSPQARSVGAGLGTVVLCVLSGAVLWALLHGLPAPEVKQSPIPSAARIAPPARPVSERASQPASVAPNATSVTALPQPAAASRKALPPRQQRPAPTPPPTASGQHASPERELELLRKAQQALARTPAAAEAFLDEHARDYAQGVFVQEREMLRIEVALARKQSTRAQALARQFLARFSGSTYQRQLERLLARENPLGGDTQSMDSNRGDNHALGSSD